MDFAGAVNVIFDKSCRSCQLNSNFEILRVAAYVGPSHQLRDLPQLATTRSTSQLALERKVADEQDSSATHVFSA